MASAELKQIREALTKESIREHQLSKVGGTETDMFICNNCHGKSCSYTQVCVAVQCVPPVSCLCVYLVFSVYECVLCMFLCVSPVCVCLVCPLCVSCFSCICVFCVCVCPLNISVCVSPVCVSSVCVCHLCVLCHLFFSPTNHPAVIVSLVSLVDPSPCLSCCVSPVYVLLCLLPSLWGRGLVGFKVM